MGQEARILKTNSEESREGKLRLSVTGKVHTGCLRSLWELLCGSYVF